MKIEKTILKDVLIFTPTVFGDKRGYFLESFNADFISKEIGDFKFVQDNQSLSSKDVLRGLHFQNPPFDQG